MRRLLKSPPYRLTHDQEAGIPISIPAKERLAHDRDSPG